MTIGLPNGAFTPETIRPRDTVDEAGYQKGDIAYYKENNLVVEVEVLRNMSTPEIMKYDLKVHEVLARGPFNSDYDPGDTFSVEKVANEHQSGLWHLIDRKPLIRNQK